MPKSATPEGVVLRAILNTLRIRGVFAFRNNAGVLPNPSGRPVRFGKVGASDVLAILQPSGRFLAIEAKTPGREKTLTPAQHDFLTAIRDAGGVALVISDVADLWRALDELDREPDRVFDLPERPEEKKREVKA